MKRFYFVIALMLTFLCGLAETEIWVGSVRAYVRDYAYILSGPGIDGEVSFSKVNGVPTLTLDNATITSYYLSRLDDENRNGFGIYLCGFEKFNICLIGENRIIAPAGGLDYFAALFVNSSDLSSPAEVTIYGGGSGLKRENNSLTVEYDNQKPFGAIDSYLGGGTLTVKNCRMNLSSSSGFRMSWAKDHLVFDGAHITHGNGDSDVNARFVVHDVTLKNCDITVPRQGFVCYDGGFENYVTIPQTSPDYALLASDGRYLKTMEISPDVRSYPILINGEPITVETKDDVFGDGKARFNPETVTLTLSGTTTNSRTRGTPIIESLYENIDSVSLTVVSDKGTSNNFYGLYDDTPCFVAHGDVTFAGEGTALFQTESHADAMVMYGYRTTLSFDYTSVIARGERGITHAGMYGYLYSNASTVIATATRSGDCGIRAFNKFTCRATKFDPDDTKFSDGAFYNDGQVLQQVHLMPDNIVEWPIKINGMTVNTGNRQNIRCPGLEEGKISLDKYDNLIVLTLDGVKLNLQNGVSRMIEYLYDEDCAVPMQINLIGDNRLLMGHYNNTIGIFTDAGLGTTSITGDSLRIESSGSGCSGIVIMGSRNNGALKGDLELANKRLVTNFAQNNCYALSAT
ncbi:MAG: hypothetical protein IJ626_03620 [Muribaculaceae bacterium]|nr:hypothetical protein [Muribaculaceae bacterium]